jgi:hypothetical protein
VLALIAPRPAVIVAPKLDYHATAADVRACVEAADKVYELLAAKGKLVLLEPEDYGRFSPALQQVAFDALQRMTVR